MRVAAIDCGTNTIRLLIAEASDRGLVELDRQMAYVRLGQGVDATGEFHPDALQRTFAACEEFARRITELRVDRAPVDRVRFVATSAARDVSNRDEFFSGVAERIGRPPEVIPGAEEAELSFIGAVNGLAAELTDPVLVMDIGGGSTELVLGREGRIEYASSLDLGSVRLTERMFHDDPVPAGQWQEAAALVEDQLAALPINFAEIASWIGVAGTVTTLSAIHLGLTAYDREQVHGSRIERDQVIRLADRFAASTAADRAAIAVLPPRRADVITAGALIASRVAQRVRTDLQVSETDILDGIATRLAGLA